MKQQGEQEEGEQLLKTARDNINKRSDHRNHVVGASGEQRLYTDETYKNPNTVFIELKS